MTRRVSRQSEYYGGSEEALGQSIQAEAHRVASESFSFGHLLNAPGIGRQGDDPREV